MKLKPTIVAAALVVGLALPALAQDSEGPVYLLANLHVSDLDGYLSDYGFPVMPMLLGAGGEVLVATPQVTVLEGDYTSNWSVVVRFPNQAAADGWYTSPEYQAMIPVRQGLTDTETSTLVIAPHFAMPEQ
jgi:uncharacterized protein (DUF1330 family)